MSPAGRARPRAITSSAAGCPPTRRRRATCSEPCSSARATPGGMSRFASGPAGDGRLGGRRVQNPDGGVMEGTVGTEAGRRRLRSTRAWCCTAGSTCSSSPDDDRYLDAANGRDAGFLVGRPRCRWCLERGDVAYRGLATTYHSRVAWAVLRSGLHTGSEEVGRDGRAAQPRLDARAADGPTAGSPTATSFRGLEPEYPRDRLHAPGLLESGLLLDEPAYLEAVETDVRAADSQSSRRWGPGAGDVRLATGSRPRATCASPASSSSATSGSSSPGEVTGDQRWRNAGLKAVAQAG